jgi:hypothetical protein
MNYLSQFNELIKQLGIVKLLQSKRFWSAIGGVFTVIVAQYAPDYEHLMPQVIESVTVGVVALVGGYSIVDAVTAAVNAWFGNKHNE